MNWLVEHYETFFTIIGSALIALVVITSWCRLTMSAKKEKALDILIGLVLQAEKQFTTPGAGPQKFEVVYKTFKTKFPLLSMFLTYEVVSSLIEEALRIIKQLLEDEKNKVTK